MAGIDLTKTLAWKAARAPNSSLWSNVSPTPCTRTSAICVPTLGGVRSRRSGALEAKDFLQNEAPSKLMKSTYDHLWEMEEFDPI
jgi:hypothetical protein